MPDPVRSDRVTRRSLTPTRGLVGLAMRVERIWPLLVPIVMVGVAFLVLSWFGAFRSMPDWARILTLVGLGGAALFGLWPLRHYRDPRAAEIDRRLETANELRHQPLSAQTDTLPDNADPFARALWMEHRKRMAEGLDRLGPTTPRAGMPARDPWALRTLAPLALIVAFAFSFGSGGGRILDAFRPSTMSETVAARLDAWVTPPDYTGVPPIFLTRGEGAEQMARSVPEGSVFTLRIAEGDGGETVELIAPDGSATPLGASEDADARASANGASVHETVLEETASIRVTIGGAAREFAFEVIADREPAISWREIGGGEPYETSRTGALTLHYEASDDYPLAGARAVFEPVAAPTDGGARPLYDVPEMALAVPRIREGAQGPEPARQSRDLTEHPMAGAVMDVTLEVTDKAGHVARSETLRMTLPEREFRDPLALAVLEQRRALALDAQQAGLVVENLDLVMLHAETTIDDTIHFLGLNTARNRVANAWSDDLLRDAVDYLWELARGIEDGAVSTAERRLRDAQDALEQALEEGATDEEIAALMDELREAMREFMQAMAERMRDMPQQAMPMQPDMQFMDQNDLERMLDNMEEMARSGQRDQAQAMLDEMRRMMEQLQAGTPQQQQQGDQQMGEMQQQMQEMGDLLREQQELMDETFRMEGSRPPPGGQQNPESDPFGEQPFDPLNPNQSPMPPQAGQPPQGGEQQQGQQQQGEQGQQQQQQAGPQPGEPMTPEEYAEALEQLRQRQEELQQRLDEMQQAMEGMGLEPGEQFGEAGEAMGDAEGNLGEGQTGPATGDQGRAIEALRQGAQNMMQQMMQAMQGQNGQGMQPGMQPGQQPGMQPGQNPGNRFTRGFGGTRNDRDPLGRPRATQGPQFGDEIEVPDEIDTQRARRILESIRRRLGRQLTPKLEREYLERLLDMR